MPFIRGRYYINPIAGEALEAAREAEAALEALASEGGTSQEPGEQTGLLESGPIHRVEIEAAELVPSHSGRGQKGFVARVHRNAGPSKSEDGRGLPAAKYAPGSQAPGQPETRAFANYEDLLNFLQGQFSRGAKG